jgi:hypothetical protein
MLELFDQVSIEANRQGQKSASQIKEIKTVVNPGVWLYGGLGIFILGGCSFAGMSAMSDEGGGALNVLAGILVIVGVVAALRGFTIWNLRRKLLKEPVQFAEGTVTYKMQGKLAQIIQDDHYSAETNDGRTLHPIGLAGVNPKLPPGLYHFYYLKPRNWLLASEPLFTEAEMNNNLNTLLQVVIGYDQAHLENCRKEAKAGLLQTVEGLPKLDMEEETDSARDIKLTHYYCALGDKIFGISTQVHDAIFDKIPYRAYYKESQPHQMIALEVVW